MGGRIGFSIVKYALDRFHSLIIGGISSDTPYTDFPPTERISLLRKGMTEYVANDEAKERRIEPDRKARLLDNDPKALIAATIAPMGTYGVKELLLGLYIPCLLYCGEADEFFNEAKEAAKAIPYADFPRLNHGQTFRARATACYQVPKGRDHEGSGRGVANKRLAFPYFNTFPEEEVWDVRPGDKRFPAS